MLETRSLGATRMVVGKRPARAILRLYPGLREAPTTLDSMVLAGLDVHQADGRGGV